MTCVLELVVWSTLHKALKDDFSDAGLLEAHFAEVKRVMKESEGASAITPNDETLTL